MRGYHGESKGYSGGSGPGERSGTGPRQPARDAGGEGGRTRFQPSGYPTDGPRRSANHCTQGAEGEAQGGADHPWCVSTSRTNRPTHP